MKSTAIAIIIFFSHAVSISMAGDNRWTFLGPEGGSIESFTFHPQLKGTIYASGNGLFRSRDFGQSWERLPLAGGIVRIHPKSPGTIVAALWDMVFASTDKGDTWEVICPDTKTSDGFHDIEFHPTDPRILYGVTYRTGVFKSTDGGKSWIRKSAGLKLEPAFHGGRSEIEVDPSDGNRAYVLLSSSRVYKTTNGGDSWVELKKGLEILEHVMAGIAIDIRNPQTLYVVGQVPAVYKTTSGPSAGGTRVTILAPSGTSGTQFNVLFGSTVALDVGFTPPNIITCTSPAGSGTVDVRVTSFLTSTTVGTFTYQ